MSFILPMTLNLGQYSLKWVSLDMKRTGKDNVAGPVQIFTSAGKKKTHTHTKEKTLKVHALGLETLPHKCV